MRLRLLLLSVIIFLKTYTILGQVPGVIQWQLLPSNNSNDSVKCILPTSDGGLIAHTYASAVGAEAPCTTNTSSVFKVDKNGTIQWATCIDNGSKFRKVIAGLGGTFYLFGEYFNTAVNQDFVIAKFGSDGSLIWKKTYGGSRPDQFADVVATNDNGFVLMGTTYSDNSGDVVGYTNHPYVPGKSDVWLLKIDGDGNKVWQQTLGGSESEEGVNVVKDGTDFIIGGETSSADGDVTNAKGGKDIWIVKIDKDAQLLWSKALGGSSYEYFTQLKELPDGSFVALASASSTDFDINDSRGGSVYDIWLVKFNTNGVILLNRSYGGSEWDDARTGNITVASDGNLIIAGSTMSTDLDLLNIPALGGLDVWVFKVNNNNGNILWGKTFGGSEYEDPNGLHIETSGELLLNVYTQSYDEFFAGGFTTAASTAANNIDAWLVKLNSGGGVLWKKPFGGSGNDYAHVLPASDKEYFLWGSTGSFARTPGDVADSWIMKLGPANIVKATVFIDKNSNGVKDSDEPFTNNVTVSADKRGIITKALMLGRHVFRMDVDTGAYTVTVLSNQPYFNVVPASRTVNYTDYFNIDSISFALQPIPGNPDLEIALIPVTPARPGFNTTYKLVFKNKGTENITSGTIKLELDNHLTFLSSTLTPSTTTPTTLTWDYSGLNVGDAGTITLECNVKAPTHPTYPTNVGDVLHLRATISPVAGDITPKDDTAILDQRVVGSFDPNDKSESHNGVITDEQIAGSEYLNYLIRFQNMGTDTAFTVIVKDTLESRLDWSTLQMNDASHPYQLSVENGNIITWRFDAINLPDDKVNEPRSHGYISFRIRPRSTVLVGDVIRNDASIYFDYNLPIVTNELEIQAINGGVVLPLQLLSFTASLNGEKVQLKWLTLSEENTSHFVVEKSKDGLHFSSIARKEAKNMSGNHTYSFVDNLPLNPVNYYRLKMVDNDGSVVYSNVVRIALQGDQGVPNIEIFPNPARSHFTLRVNGKIKEKGNAILYTSNGIEADRFILTKSDELYKDFIFNLSHLASGIYYLKVDFGNQKGFMKLVKE